ncbi:hypothetical protein YASMINEVIRUS_824 [Yasminevirus sp. GU-2018]|uniref:Uncharacterized protein n=1 Tax=Yasminevirus sp. GU-2018 TaxID=2420051 RepID=A0A5K0U9U2_9VIRU|nr:hypothetical protein YASMINEVIRUS_824 [Yasminevirus sp. GU-2018]
MPRTDTDSRYKAVKDKSFDSDDENTYISGDEVDEDIDEDINDDVDYDGTADDNEDNEDNEDNDEDEEEDEDNDSKQSKSKKVKKVPVKTKKLPLKDALKSVEERSLYTEVDRFFTTKCDQKKIQKMVRIINNEDTISLRLLNWFAMKYSSTMEALDFVNADGKMELFDVKISYRARLNTHSKKHFDPFRRGRKFDYNYDKKDKTKVVETTLCQLNFFRWMYMHNLMDYVEENFETLKNKMGSFNTQEKKKKETKKEKEKLKKQTIKNKKNEMSLKVKRFNEGSTNKVVIII